VVTTRLGSDPAVIKIEAEAVQDEGASERTQRRVQDAVEDAVEQDQDFAAALQQVLDELKQLQEESSRPAGFDLRGAQGVQFGDHNSQTNTFG
jgi:flagellar hook-basal body complex protein FliE